jgi:hypothetical protein
MHIIFWLEILKRKDHVEDLGFTSDHNIEWMLGKYGGKVWTGCIWLRIGTSGGLLL